MMVEAHNAAERLAQAEALKPQLEKAWLPAREVSLLPAPDGTMRANEKGKPDVGPGRAGFIARAFGDR